MQESTVKLFIDAGQLIEGGHFKQALEGIFEYIRAANRYFDEQQPWIQVKEDTATGDVTLATCVYIIANLGQLLQPFLPFSAGKIRDMLGMKGVVWHEQVEIPLVIGEVAPLFERIDVGLIEDEYNKLVDSSK